MTRYGNAAARPCDARGYELAGEPTWNHMTRDQFRP